MNRNTITSLRLYIILVLVLGLAACTKDRSCEGCATNESNQPPVALAGADEVTVLPRDSVLLDGSASTDPDGRVVAWEWRKVAGPASSSLLQPAAAKTTAKGLGEGVYLFELTVTDDGGAQDRDTVQVTVRRGGSGNQPPVALAGADTTLTLPANKAILDGKASYDPDGMITAYRWTKIEGPAAFLIDEPAAATTGVQNLFAGVYRFELAVTDNDGLTAKDTLQVSVKGDPLTNTGACNGANRPLVQARLVSVGQLSLARHELAVAAAGGKLLFAGGWVAPNTKVTRVDILDIASGRWSRAELPGPGSGLATAVLGNKVFLAGTMIGNSGSARVDIYDAASNSWSASSLSVGRFSMAGAAVAGKVLFAAGLQYVSVYRHQVDIYDSTTRNWSLTTLDGRTGTGTVGLAAAVAGNRVYLAGEGSDWYTRGAGSFSSTINIYDALTNTWSQAALRQARGYMAGIGAGGKLYWAGGVVRPGVQPFTDEVEIMDVATGTSSFGCLFQPNAFFTAVAKDRFIVFFTGAGAEKNKFDIYDTATNTWSVGVLPFALEGASILSVNNTLYVAGGKVNGALTAGVWKLEF